MKYCDCNGTIEELHLLEHKKQMTESERGQKISSFFEASI